MKRIPQIKAVMTPFPHAIEHRLPLGQAAEQMREHKIRHLPVTKDGELAGLISERDIAIYTQGTKQGEGAREVVVSDIAVSEVYVVDLTESLDNVLIHMSQHHIDCALVTKNGKLAGLFTVTDVCREFAGYLRHQFLPDDGNDAA